MSKPVSRTPFNLKSLTLLVSLAGGVVIGDVAGKRWRLMIPVNGLVFDKHGDLPALFYSIDVPQWGNASVPAPDGVALGCGGNNVLQGDDGEDARQAVISRLVVELEVGEDAEAFADIPLIFKGANACTDAPATFTLDAFVADEEAPFAVTDFNGGPIGITAVELEGFGGGGSLPASLEALDDLLIMDDGVLVTDDDGPVYDI